MTQHALKHSLVTLGAIGEELQGGAAALGFSDFLSGSNPLFTGGIATGGDIVAVTEGQGGVGEGVFFPGGLNRPARAPYDEETVGGHGLARVQLVLGGHGFVEVWPDGRHRLVELINFDTICRDHQLHRALMLHPSGLKNQPEPLTLQ